MDELETLLKTQAIENKIITLICEKLKQQEEEIKALKLATKKELEFLTESDVIDIFKTSHATLYRLAKFKKLPLHKHGKSNRYIYSELVEFFANPQNFQYGMRNR